MFGTAVFAQSAPTVGVTGSFPSSVQAGTQDTAVAFITLTASGAPTSTVSVTSLPIVFANTGVVSDCRLHSNGAELGGGLNTGSNVLLTPGVVNQIMLDAPLQLTTGAPTTQLTLRCDISAATPVGYVLGIAFAPGNIVAQTGTSTAIIPFGLGIPSGAPFAGEFTILGGTGTPTPTPGTPNTGAGGNAAMILTLLTLAGVVAIGGMVRLVARRA